MILLEVDEEPYCEHQQEDIYRHMEHGGYLGMEQPYAKKADASTEEQGGGKGEEYIF